MTGAAGQDGSLLCERLLADGLVVHGLAFNQTEADAIKESSPDVVVHVGDLGDTEAMAQLVTWIAPDQIFNLGGISSVAFSWDNPLETGRVTGLGAVGMFEAARRCQEQTRRPVRVLQASSAEIFGQPEQAPQDEATPIRPVSPYGVAKAYAHQSASLCRSRGLFVATVILFNHESPRRPPTFVTRKITSSAARIARQGGMLSLGNLDARRDWGWAPDYVDAMVRAIRHEEPDDFVVATGETHSVADFVAAAFARVGIEDWPQHVQVDPALVRPVDATEQRGDASKAKRLLGWEPSVAFDELVGRMVDADVALLERLR
ncbi:MAG: GDP-mannose 4,6-dehydratase [Propionibacteriaceae bacterium]|nr:GDP-mannose 4,6-dehydratase [Propionibacteriaceae bacterium]